MLVDIIDGRIHELFNQIAKESVGFLNSLCRRAKYILAFLIAAIFAAAASAAAQNKPINPLERLTYTYGLSGQYYYSKNAAAAGYAAEYGFEMPVGSDAFGKATYIDLNYYGKLNGLRLAYEKTLLGKEESSFYSLRLGAFYSAYWGNPVHAIKDNYIDQVPNFYHEIGLALRPAIFHYKNLTASILDAYIAIDPVSAAKLNYGFSLFTYGVTL